jgi:hypothetical protein
MIRNLIKNIVIILFLTFITFKRNTMKYTLNPDGTVNTVITDDKSEIRIVLAKYVTGDLELSEDMMDYDSHRLFK